MNTLFKITQRLFHALRSLRGGFAMNTTSRVCDTLIGYTWAAHVEWYDYIQEITFYSPTQGMVMWGGGQRVQLIADFDYHLAGPNRIHFEFATTYLTLDPDDPDETPELVFEPCEHFRSKSVDFTLHTRPSVVRTAEDGRRTFALEFEGHPFPGNGPDYLWGPSKDERHLYYRRRRFEEPRLTTRSADARSRHDAMRSAR